MFFSFLKRKNFSKEVKTWIKSQSDSRDALLYLIEKEIHENGHNDLAYIIPRYRNEEYFETDYYGKAQKPHGAKRVSPGLVFKEAIEETVSKPHVETKPRVGDHVPNELEILRDKKKQVKEVKKVEDFTARHVQKVMAVNHGSHVAQETVFLQQPQKRDLSEVDLSCFDD